MILRGTVTAGRREATGFLAIPWVAQGLQETFGLTPYPGTLNLRLTDPDALRRWAQVQATGAGRPLHPPEHSDACAATCHPVSINGAVPGVSVRPAVPGYPPDLVEVVAAEPLRQRFGLADGAICHLRFATAATPPIAGVLFDLEGTLVDFQWQLAAAENELRAAVADLGFDAARFATDNYAAILRSALATTPSPERRQEIIRRLSPIYDHYDQDALSRWSLREGARALLEDLRGCAIPAGLVSNIGRSAVTGALEKFGLEDLFQTTVTRNNVAQMKPDGAGIRRALDVLGLAADQTLMVGDSLSDLGAARDAGVAVVIVAGGESSAQAVAAAQPEYCLRHLTEVADLI